MPIPTILPDARRSTRVELIIAERHQVEVIARLHSIGEDHLADRLDRCQQARRDRQPGSWPWRCRSAGCWACRRAITRRWWRGFLGWLGSGPDVSLVTIPITSEVLVAIKRIRKGLRDVRDRAARIDERWSAVAMAGTVSGDHLVFVVHHAEIKRDTLWTALERRWPQVIVTEFETVEPRSELSVETTVQLAVQGRGIEPIRVVIPAQRRAHEIAEHEQPMPVLV